MTTSPSESRNEALQGKTSCVQENKSRIAARISQKKNNARFYEIPGMGQVPSVTTVLSAIAKPALIGWAAKVEREMVIEVSSRLHRDMLGKEVNQADWTLAMNSLLGQTKASQKLMSKAGDIGSQAHKLIEWQINAWMGLELPKPEVVEQALWAFMAWEDWAKSVHLKPLASEQVVWSLTHGYAGTLDLLAEVNGEQAVLDWKTGKAVYSEAHLQNAAYRHAIREMGHGDPVKGYIVRLPKNTDDPAFEVVVADPEGPALEVFLETRKLWAWCQIKEAEYEAKRG